MKLARYAYMPLATLGWLYLGTHEPLHTIERPWIPGPTPGGRPHVSCVPDGDYELLRHARPNGDVCVALRNPAHGVYYSEASLPQAGGRTLILIHAANYAEELQGCIAPGLDCTIHENRLMVTRSRQAMEAVMAAFDEGDKTLSIRPALGAKEAA